MSSSISVRPVSSKNCSVQTDTEADTSRRLELNRVPDRVLVARYPVSLDESTEKGLNSKTSPSSDS